MKSQTVPNGTLSSGNRTVPLYAAAVPGYRLRHAEDRRHIEVDAVNSQIEPLEGAGHGELNLSYLHRIIEDQADIFATNVPSTSTRFI